MKISFYGRSKMPLQGTVQPRPALAGLLVLLLAAVLTACSAGGDPASTPTPQGSEQTVPLQVVQGPGGSVLALVPVYINDQGPYYFALDTGASTSAIDSVLVDQLGLQVVGRPQQVTGITGSVVTRLVRVDTWRVGNVPLPAANVTDLNLPGPSTGGGLQGLLGSDMLSHFGAVTVDYDRKLLVLRTHS